MRQDNFLLFVLLGSVGYLLYKSFYPGGVVGPFPAGKTAPSPPPSRTFDKKGADYVRWVQSTLNSLIQAGLKVDGIYGPKTRGMVTTYQGMCGIPASGEMDEATETCLRADIAKFPERF